MSTLLGLVRRSAGLLALLALACSEPGEREELQRQLDRNRARWDALGVDTYSMRERVLCFCAFGPDEVIITVDADTIVSVTFADTGEPADTATYRYYYSVDDLFDLLQDAIRRADDVQASFDPDYFFPSSISIDWIERAIDDELGVVAGSLTR